MEQTLAEKKPVFERGAAKVYGTRVCEVCKTRNRNISFIYLRGSWSAVEHILEPPMCNQCFKRKIGDDLAVSYRGPGRVVYESHEFGGGLKMKAIWRRWHKMKVFKEDWKEIFTEMMMFD